MTITDLILQDLPNRVGNLETCFQKDYAGSQFPTTWIRHEHRVRSGDASTGTGCSFPRISKLGLVRAVPLGQFELLMGPG